MSQSLAPVETNAIVTTAAIPAKWRSLLDKRSRDFLHFIANETEAARRNAQLWQGRFRRVVTAPHGHKAQVWKDIAREAGLSEGTIRTRFTNLKKVGFDALIDRTRFPAQAHRSTLPKPFVEHWKGIVGSYQRATCGKAAYRHLLDSLKAWRRDPHNPELVIPGYTTPPKNSPGCDCPPGWSYATLMRNSPTEIEKKARREGRTNARELLPPVLTSRVPYKVGQVVFIDDQWYDQHTFLAKIGKKSVRPLGFNILDLASGAQVDRGYKPRNPDAETGEKALNQRDVQFLVVSYLSIHGYRTDTGTVICGEHGGASLSDDFQERLAIATDGKVTFEDGPTHGKAFAGLGYRENPRGNPRFKAPIESSFNLQRNESAFLPGAAGRKPELAPSEHYGISAYLKKWLPIIQQYPPEVQSQFRLPYLDWHRMIGLLEDLYKRINARTDHNLQGWGELGYNILEYCIDEDRDIWIGEHKLVQLPQAQQDRIFAALPCEPRPTKIPPGEVFEAGRHELQRLSPHTWHMLLDSDCSREITVKKNHLITIKDQEIWPAPLHYSTKIETKNGVGNLVLRAGEQIKVNLNPFRPESIQVLDSEGRPVGIAHLKDKPGRHDIPAVEAQIVEREQIYSALTAGARERAEPKARQRRLDQAHNERLHESLQRGETPTKKASPKKQSAIAKRAALARAAQEH